MEGLYTNILHDEGLQSLEDGLKKRINPEIPTDYLIKLMEIILKNNLFIFHEELWRQEIGCAMGTKPVPSYADKVMAKRIEDNITGLVQKHGITNKSPS